jgi:sulfatase maturation enzyme AslB (radical SAM superfamily)
MSPSVIDKYFLPLKNRDVFSITENFYIDISMVCNLNCRYCNIVKLQKYREVLTFDKFEVVIKNIDPNKAYNITFYGGEPLIFLKELVLMIELLKKINPQNKISVFTNGILINETVEKLAKSGVINLIISLDGEKTINDMNRKYKYNKKSVYKDVISNLKKYSLFEYSNVNVVISLNNYKYLEKSLSHLVELGFKNINFDIDYTAKWSDFDLKNLRIKILSIAKKYFSDIKNGKKYCISNFFRNPVKKNNNVRYLFLMPDGNFYYSEYVRFIDYKNHKQEILKFFERLARYDNMSINEIVSGICMYILHKGKINFDIFIKIEKMMKEILNKFTFDYENTGWNRK